MTLWTNSYDRRSDRRYDPTGHLMTVKTTVDSTGGPIVRLILIKFTKIKNTLCNTFPIIYSILKFDKYIYIYIFK